MFCWGPLLNIQLKYYHYSKTLKSKASLLVNLTPVPVQNEPGVNLHPVQSDPNT